MNTTSNPKAKALAFCRQIAPTFIGTACLTVFMIVVGCGQSDQQPTVDRVAVAGQVTLDGQPLPSGAIIFRSPPSASSENEVVTAFAFVENGRYRIDAKNGPAVGKAQVVFRPKPLAREEMEAALDQSATSRRRHVPRTSEVKIPKRYGDDSDLRVELVNGAENQHDFQLRSRS